MSHSSSSLTVLFVEAFRQQARNRPVPAVEVKFYPYAGLHHTIRVRAGRVYVRLSDIFADAPPGVCKALAFILVSKLLKGKCPVVYERIYREYAYRPEVLRASDIARRRRGHKMVSSARGSIYDLERVFTRLNRKFFDGELKMPTLTWSQRRTHRILGHHDPVHETIVVSKTLDAEDIPSWFVDYIVYHEMLHIKHPARVVRGRRLYHSAAFRNDERRFPYYEQAQDWLEGVSRSRRPLRARAA